MIKEINAKTIKNFGRIIEYPYLEKKGTSRNLWKVVHKSETCEGWRIAYLVLRDKSLGCLQCHPNTDETFEPIKGKAVIFLSRQKDPAKIEAFWLDKPIVVFSGIWHGVIAVQKEAHLKIFENNIVQSERFPLSFRLDIETYKQKIKKI